MNVDDLKGLITKQFEWQRPVLALWQTLADNFYPERADFTITRNTGTELADNLMSSYPLLVRRDLGNSLSAMLRDGDWFKVGVNEEPSHSGQAWLDWSTKRLKRIMYDKTANFVKATKQADHDYVTFGQPVLSVEPNRQYNGLLFRTWHLRDCAWWEDENGQVEGVVRKWKPTYMQLARFFGKDKLAPRMLQDFDKNKMKEADIVHVHMLADEYGEDTHFRYVSIYLDMANDHIIEEVFTNHRHYVVPRFQTIAGSPYAYSPATVVGLPDSRMLQAMTHTLIEAGERYARPPMIATTNVVEGVIDLSPDGITFVDKEYDERMGQALRTITQDRGGYPIGLEMRDNVVEVLSSAFYRDKLTLPEVTHEMTAYEVQERMKQFRRENLPLFAPIEAEYNGSLCEQAFDLAMEMGMLGSPYDIPEELQEQDVVFKFESPLTESEEEKKAQRFQQVSQMVAEAAQLDPGVIQNVNFDEALRDAITGIGSPQEWMHPIEEVQAGRQQAAAEEMMAMQAQAEGGAA